MIAIKGMRMPASCYSCRFCKRLKIDESTPYCVVKPLIWIYPKNQQKGRPANCPLVKIEKASK